MSASNYIQHINTGIAQSGCPIGGATGGAVEGVGSAQWDGGAEETTKEDPIFMLASHIAARPAATEKAGLPGCLGTPVGAGGPVDSVGGVGEPERVQRPPAECSVGLTSGAGEFDAAGNMFLQERLVVKLSLIHI